MELERTQEYRCFQTDSQICFTMNICFSTDGQIAVYTSVCTIIELYIHELFNCGSSFREVPVDFIDLSFIDMNC